MEKNKNKKKIWNSLIPILCFVLLVASAIMELGTFDAHSRTSVRAKDAEEVKVTELQTTLDEPKFFDIPKFEFPEIVMPTIKEDPEPEPIPEPTPEPAPEPITITTAVENNTCSKYNQLSQTEKEAYKKILEAAQNREDSVQITLGLEGIEESVSRCVMGVLYDNPQLFWLKDGYSGSYRLHKYGISYEVTIDFMVYDYFKYKVDLEPYIDEFNQKVQAVVDETSKFTTDYEKALYVHDYLVQKCYYDTDRLAASEMTYHDAKSELIRSAYTCFEDGGIVCAAYAKGFQHLMNELGIDCTYVVGEAGESHAWNCVQLDGAYYLMDVTWDDPVGDNTYLRRDYFALTDEELGRDHTPDEEFYYPTCTETACNYFTRNGYVLPKYDFNQVAKILEAQKTNDSYSIKFENADAYRTSMKELFEKGNWSKISFLNDEDGIVYYLSDTLSIITITDK